MAAHDKHETATTALLRAMVRDVPASLVVTDLDGRVLLANRSARRLLGLPGKVRLVDGVHPDDSRRLSEYVASVAASAAHRSQHLAELQVRWGDVERVIAVDGRRLRGIPGFRGLVFSLQDVTQYVGELRSLRLSAYEDALTGLPNRAAFHNATDQALRAKAPGALLMIDLDSFKRINDEHGHEAGDRVLVTFAERLVDLIPEHATAARIGGDEFVVLLTKGGDDEARRVAELVVRASERPVSVGHTDVVVSASVGGSTLVGPRAEHAMRRADEMLYVAKRTGRAAWRMWSDDDEEWRVRKADVTAELEALRVQLTEVYVESRTDFMTGLPNTRRLFEDLDQLGRDGAPESAGLVFIDLDFFGSVNREHGDRAGDDVLRQVGEVFRDACRDGDTVYRKGGEEFVVLLPGADLDQAVRVAERFRLRLLQHGIPHRGRADQPVVTLSAGVASGQLGETGSVDALMHEAAMRMLAAKQSGRNRVVSDGGALA